MPTTTRVAKAKSRTYNIYFHGGPLDGRHQLMPITSRWGNKNPRFINKSLWDIPKTLQNHARVFDYDKSFTKQDAYYVASHVSRMNVGDRRDYNFDPNYDPSKDLYFLDFPDEKPI